MNTNRCKTEYQSDIMVNPLTVAQLTFSKRWQITQKYF